MHGLPQTRNEIRQTYLDVWEKMQQQQLLQPMEVLIADVIRQHPEYHRLLESADGALHKDFHSESGGTNAFLHMGMHIALREQASTDRPPGVQSIYRKLVQMSGQHLAEHAMMECLGQLLWTAQTQQVPPDEDTYLACLQAL